MNRIPSFPNTRWTRVACASDPSHPRAKTALAELFQLYWYPIYAFIRRSGYSHQDAEDLTQSFFLYVHERGTLQRADPAKGRFRTFVIACLRHFLGDARRFQIAAKRGGGKQHIEFDGMVAEARYAAEPVDHLSPERLFEQKLALEILDRAIAELEGECADDGKTEIIIALRGYLDGDGNTENYRAISARLSIPVGTLKSHVHRLRDRLRKLLIERVDHIVAGREDVKSELVALEESL